MHKRLLRIFSLELIGTVVSMLLLSVGIGRAAGITLQWDATPEPSVKGYKIYYKFGTSGPPYDGSGAFQGSSPITVPLGSFYDPSHPQYTLFELSDTKICYLAVTAYNDVAESGFSNEAAFSPSGSISGFSPIRINAGGGAYTDGSGNVWSADTGSTSGSSASTADPISGTADDALFQSERWSSGQLSYGFDVPDGDYTVKLYFADIYNGTAGVGLRVFDILLEGQPELSHLDIYGEVGHDAALVKSFTVTVTDGQLNIDLAAIVESPKISAIEITSSGNPGGQTVDTDGDGISDDDEINVYGTNPDSADSDADGLADGIELAYWGTAWSADNDADGLINLIDSDSDNDGFADGEEVAKGYDPSDPNSFPAGVTTFTPIRINAGGGAYTDGSGNVWSADTGSTSGSSASTADPISGTADDALFQSERWSSGQLSYGFDVPDGDYTVKLYFADIYNGTAGVGLRVFDILLEGQPELSHLDIYGEVGHDAALVKSFTVTVTDGQLNIDLPAIVESPKISAIEVLSGIGSGGGGGPVFTPIRINAGGGAYTDGSGNVWSADTGSTSGSSASTADPISGTADDALFQSERWSSGQLSYGFDVPDGDYTVKLYFADIYNGTAGVGLRVFDILLEGQPELSHLDIYGEVGHDAALVKSFTVTVTDGQLNIDLAAIVESPKISAIEIFGN